MKLAFFLMALAAVLLIVGYEKDNRVFIVAGALWVICFFIHVVLAFAHRKLNK